MLAAYSMKMRLRHNKLGSLSLHSDYQVCLHSVSVDTHTKARTSLTAEHSVGIRKVYLFGAPLVALVALLFVCVSFYNK